MLEFNKYFRCLNDANEGGNYQPKLVCAGSIPTNVSADKGGSAAAALVSQK